MYYSRFDLLCIDEFSNGSEMDPFLVHQIFNMFSERGHSILLCMQCQPEKMEELFSITSIGQPIKGRILPILFSLFFLFINIFSNNYVFCSNSIVVAYRDRCTIIHVWSTIKIYTCNFHSSSSSHPLLLVVTLPFNAKLGSLQTSTSFICFI